MLSWSVGWVIALTLFLGGLGAPVPENPILVGGGYVIYQDVSPPVFSLFLWYAAILGGDFFLFAFFHFPF